MLITMNASENFDTINAILKYKRSIKISYKKFTSLSKKKKVYKREYG